MIDIRKKNIAKTGEKNYFSSKQLYFTVHPLTKSFKQFNVKFFLQQYLLLILGEWDDIDSLTGRIGRSVTIRSPRMRHFCVSS